MRLINRLVPTLFHTSGLPHSREVLATLADVMLPYADLHNPAYQVDGEDGPFSNSEWRHLGLGEAVDLLTRGCLQSSADSYIDELGCKQPQTVEGDMKLFNPVIGKRKCASPEYSFNMLVTDGVGTGADMSEPLWITALPILVEMQARLSADSDIDSAVRI